jgi:hypothetical protein
MLNPPSLTEFERDTNSTRQKIRRGPGEKGRKRVSAQATIVVFVHVQPFLMSRALHFYNTDVTTHCQHFTSLHLIVSTTG